MIELLAEVEPEILTPSIRLPDTKLRAAGVVPPMNVLLPLVTAMPASPLLPKLQVPVASVPTKFPRMDVELADPLTVIPEKVVVALLFPAMTF